MIARLTGILAETSADSAVLDVAGVGYAVLASARTLDAIGPIGGEVMLLTELQVREDQHDPVRASARPASARPSAS